MGNAPVPTATAKDPLPTITPTKRSPYAGVGWSADKPRPAPRKAPAVPSRRNPPNVPFNVRHRGGSFEKRLNAARNPGDDRARGPDQDRSGQVGEEVREDQPLLSTQQREPDTHKASPCDTALIFAARGVRLFSYGFISIALLLYLHALGFREVQAGALLTFTFVGDLFVTLVLTTTADSFGRKRTLLIGALLKVAAGVSFAFATHFWMLVVAATIGVMTASGGEIGPFIAVEQAALTQVIRRDQIPTLFAWYNMVAYACQALGAICGGLFISFLQSDNHVFGQLSPLESLRTAVLAYAVFGGVMVVLYALLSGKIEVKKQHHETGNWFSKFGLYRPQSRATVAKLSCLFACDAFAGGFTMQTILVFWFRARYGTDVRWLGALMMGTNVLAAMSALLTPPLVRAFGAVNTMVFTHLPSNVLILLVPFMPNEASAMAVLLARFCISQMDVPAREAYVVALVSPEERSAAGGIANLVRSFGRAMAPFLAGWMLSNPASFAFNLPFVVCGGIKIMYDVSLYVLVKCGNVPDAYGRFPEAEPSKNTQPFDRQGSYGSVHSSPRESV